MNATTTNSSKDPRKGWWRIECRDAEGSWSEETVGPDFTRGQALAELDACGLTPLKIRFCDGTLDTD